jgi:hypothetical protein
MKARREVVAKARDRGDHRRPLPGGVEERERRHPSLSGDQATPGGADVEAKRRHEA